MNASEIRIKYLEFFKGRGHTIIPSASLVPENDPTVLFTTAGMHPLVPFLMGEAHPGGNRLTNVQKCIRTGDIDEVGDTTHLTFFEMLGNWSLGDYFREEAIRWTFEFLTDVLGLDPKRIYATVFEGDKDAPRDSEAIAVWQDIFCKGGISCDVGRVYLYPKSENWWGPAGKTGPCGPDSEIFYDVLGDKDKTKHMYGWKGLEPCEPACSCGRYVEVGNNVFMQYFKHEDGRYDELEQKNIDFGGGLERLAMIMQEAKSVFETDLFLPLIEEIEKRINLKYGEEEETDRVIRIIADHVRSAVFILGDQRGVVPSNLDQGYVLRRLIRRSYRYGRSLGMKMPFVGELAEIIVREYGAAYPEIGENRERVLAEIVAEEEKFSKALKKGLVEAEKLGRKYQEADVISGEEAFHLYETFGFPREMTEEVIGKPVDVPAFEDRFKKHQALSRTGAEQKFSGGLADHSEEVVRLHTATHLMHQALRKVLGDHVEQKGSNITKDRLRFDFTHGEKLTEEQRAEVERIVNEQIDADLPVHFEMMTVEEAKEKGAVGLFEDKYTKLGNQIKVYFIGEDPDYFSIEICGGPHIERTSELGHITIKKEKASSAGIRRIKAILG
ncbi:MAG: alanine--tRNA ligase [Patescibacteria group bacterium]|nr:alanine--tRNA ligase [Patescibacteria group bacterium]